MDVKEVAACSWRTFCRVHGQPIKYDHPPSAESFGPDTLQQNIMQILRNIAIYTESRYRRLSVETTKFQRLWDRPAIRSFLIAIGFEIREPSGNRSKVFCRSGGC